jgi:ribonucleoside-diphosphate reductase alpha chain
VEKTALAQLGDNHMTEFQKFIALSRYARWLPDEGRRETWAETVDRYIDNVVADKAPEQKDEIRDAIRSLDVMPSMRAVMTAGKALNRDNTAGYNCFSGDTEVVTKYGIRKFKDLQIGINHTVLAGDGEWRNANVNSFGVQPVYKVTFRHSKKSGVKSEVIVTKDHRWLTENRGEVTDLRVGDTVRSNVAKKDFDMIPEAWISGFGFGDGTIDSRGRAKVRLCGDKDMRHVGIFEEYGNCSICHPPSYDGDAVVIYRKGFFEDWKKLPYHKTNNPAWISSWIAGYLEADGHNNPKQPGLSSQNQEALDFVQKYGPMCGYIITGRNNCSVMETNYGTRKSILGRLTIRDNTTFYVERMEYAGEQEVFCFTEKVTSSFTLANGALTGNCSYLPVDDPKSFDEAMFILLCGTGVGFSVERQYVNKLPELPDQLFESDTTIAVKDSKEGWAKAYRQLLSLLWAGEIPKWDVSKVRPAGAKLKTFGGRASGPGPLVDLFQFTIEKFRAATGRKLTSIECHDIMCKIGEIVVVGGVRRSAMISLSNLSDDRMRHAKSGQWWNTDPQRALANNSVSYTDKPDAESFMREWLALVESKSGERGIFNRTAAQKQAAKNGRRDPNFEFGTNPCSEIILRPYAFCNLTEAVCRADDTLEDLKEKVRLAAILGTIQSTLTHFPYLRKIWKNNTEEERLLGVSLTGIMDCEITNGSMGVDVTEECLEQLRQVAIDTNAEWAEKLCVQASTAITCVKPSGTVSQLVDSASGIHARHSEYYIRTVRGDNKDPLTQFMIDKGIPAEPCAMKPDTTTVFSFPVKAPEGAITRNDMTAIEQLDLWLTYQRHWCEHKPSVTVTVRDHEWVEVGAWVYKHFDEVSGISFLPHSDHTYKQAPYQEVDKVTYDEFAAQMPLGIKWSDLSEYEKEDGTKGSQELACSSGVCEIVDV